MVMIALVDLLFPSHSSIFGGSHSCDLEQTPLVSYSLQENGRQTKTVLARGTWRELSEHCFVTGSMTFVICWFAFYGTINIPGISFQTSLMCS